MATVPWSNVTVLHSEPTHSWSSPHTHQSAPRAVIMLAQCSVRVSTRLLSLLLAAALPARCLSNTMKPMRSASSARATIPTLLRFMPPSVVCDGVYNACVCVCDVMDGSVKVSDVLVFCVCNVRCG